MVFLYLSLSVIGNERFVNRQSSNKTAHTQAPLNDTILVFYAFPFPAFTIAPHDLSSCLDKKSTHNNNKGNAAFKESKSEMQGR